MNRPPRSRWKLTRSPLRVRPTSSTARGNTLRANKAKQKLALKRRIWQTIGKVVGVGLIVLLILFAWYAKDLPNPTNLSTRQVAQSSKILDRNGQLLYEFGEQKRTVVTADQISNYIKQATVAVEDKDFYKHHGLNFRGILRAAIYNTFGLSKYTQGGSTITQQYIKLALLTTEKKISRKIKEAILAVEIESIYSKDEILTGYLNEIPYGNNNFGVEAAAQAYFGKSAADLTLAEAATLAAIPQRPSYYSPYGSHLDELFGRKDYVLDQMAKVGFITQQEADDAKAAAPNKDHPDFIAKNSSIKAPHFVFYVRDELINMLGGDEQSAEQLLGQAGYTVTTSLDLATQQMAEKVMTDTAPKYLAKAGATNSALVAIDPASGDILAMVGSIDYFNQDWGSVNVATSLRQPGSSFKPIVYATALKGKYSPASVLFDLKTDFGNYSPDNYDGTTHGPVTIRQALNMSLNIPAVKMLDLVGIDAALKTATDLGITTLTNRQDYGLSLVLGAGEVKLVELTDAYSVFANQGKKMPLTSLLKVVDKDNKVIVDNTDVTKRAGEQVLDPQVAYLMADVMSDQAAKAPVFGKGLLVSGHTVASKTGTTQSFKDGWTVGYTPQIAVGVWAGNNDGTEMRKGADAITVAAPIWRTFMQQYLADKPNVEFTRPAGVQQVTVDRLSGKLPSGVCAADNITDWFASWNIPKDPDNVHQAVYLDKYSGKLATADTPADAVELRCYNTIHSEKPNNLNWEAPVLSWAAANGYNVNGTPPDATDDTHTADKKPTATITSPTNNQSVTAGPLTVNFSVTTPAYGLASTQLVVDDQVVATGNGDARSLNYTAVVGQHNLKIIVKDQVENTAESPIVTVTVK